MKQYGPHYVPRIACKKCGKEHHIDAASPAGQEEGRCYECSGFLREPTEAEERQFYDFMEWKDAHRRGQGVSLEP